MLDSLESTLTADEGASCEGPLSLEESFTALQGMAHRKTPGSDGRPTEFYLSFWDILGVDLVAVLNRSHRSGVLSISQRRYHHSSL